MSSSIKSLDRHYPTVDSIRGISIFLVLILHFHLAYGLGDGFFASLLPQWILHPLVRNGNYGVVIFFVISGFLINSRTLARSRDLEKVSVRDFYLYRAARIFPNILLMLSIVVSLGLAGIKIFKNNAGGPSLFVTVASIITFTHNLLMEKFGYFNYCLNILWSLSVEEVFYLTFPLLCLLAKKKWIPLGVWGFFVILGPIYRFHHHHDDTDIYGLYNYLACFDGIAIGCLAAFWRRSYIVPVWLKKVSPFFYLLITFIYFDGGVWSNLVFGISGISLLTGLSLLAMSPVERSSTWSRPLRWFGRHSYELYLFHVVILALMKTAVNRNELTYFSKPLWFLLFLILSALVASGISRYYSEPLNRRLRRAF